MNPQFAAAGSGDFTPTQPSLNDIAVPVGVLTDITGSVRGTNPDPGAYEFSTSACSGVPVAGIISTTSVLACAGGMVSFSLTGQTSGTGIEIAWQQSPAGTGQWVSIPGANTPNFAGVMNSANTDYRALVTCVNSGVQAATNILTISLNQWYMCYCSPLSGATLHTSIGNNITNVGIQGTTLNSSTTVVGSGGYTRADPSGSATTTLTQIVPYTINVTVSSSTTNVGVWVDYNQNGTFDASEYLQLNTAGTIASGTLAIPVTSMTGMTGLRLRAYTTTAYGAAGACSSITTGLETEDYVIDIAPAIVCSGTPTVVGFVTAQPTAICLGQPINLSAAAFAAEQGVTIQWETSQAGQGNWAAITGASNAHYINNTITESSDFRIAVTCNNPGGGTSYSAPVTVNVNNPQLVSVSGATVCGSGSVSLSATPGSGSIVNWYANATGGSRLYTGTAFTTPVVNATTTYYAAASTAGTSGSVGLANRVGGTTNNGYGDVGLMFDAQNSFILNSVAMYPVGTGGDVTTTIVLKDASGTALQSATVTMPTTALPGLKTVVPLNFNVPSGVGHRLVVTSATGGGIAGFIRELSSGFSYPYTIPNVVSITSAYTSGASASYYYYLYDWQITPFCEGTRVPVSVNITTAPAIGVAATSDSICLGSSSTLTVSSANTAYSYSWSNGTTGTTDIVSPMATTKYFVTANDPLSNCTVTDSVVIAVKSTAAVVNTVAGVTAYCLTGSPSLSLSPIPTAGIGFQWQKDSGSGFADIPGATGSTFTEAVSASVSYRANMYCDGAVVNTSTATSINVANPQINSVMPGANCGPGPVTLGASAATGTTIKWYTAASGGTPVGTGASFITPVLTSNATYYVAGSSGGGEAFTGLAAPSAGASSGSGTTNFGLMFDVLNPVTLNSVVIYPVSATSASGTITLQVINDAGTVLHQAVANVTGSPAATPSANTVTLNFNLTPGTNYKLRAASYTGISGLLFGPSASAPSGNYGYPFLVPGLLSINSSTLTAVPLNTPRNDLYYYFYNWKLVSGCESPRTAVTATIESPVTPTVSVNASASAVCAGGTTTLTALSTDGGAAPMYTWFMNGSPVSGASGSSYTASGIN
ncbi:MAG: hypothetical protein EOP49_10745, partial [Sphingobacteriales bacterium]